MRIDLYTITWNERRLLPFFLDYYAPWVDRIVAFDDGSDDGTAQTLAAHPKAELRTLPPKGTSFVLTALEIWRHAWKESRGHCDWVVVTNVDEFIYHPSGMRPYLAQCTERGITMIHPRGYEMVGERFPDTGQSLVDHVRTGAPMFGQDKRQVFDPGAIEEMNYGPGRHECRPIGRVIEPADVEAALLHYKYVDTHAYLLRRQKALARRMLATDRSSGFGAQYHLTPEQILRSFEWLKLHALDVVTRPAPPALRPSGLDN